MRRYRRVVETARGVASAMAISEIGDADLRILRRSFKRTLGDTSDIVTKEMYTFTDSGGEQHHVCGRRTRPAWRAPSSPAASASICR